MLAAIILIVGLIGFIALLAALRGFVLSYLWQWFLVPLGASSISVVHAIGISLLVGMFTAHLRQDDEKDGKAAKRIGLNIVGTLFALGLGYILSFYVS